MGRKRIPWALVGCTSLVVAACSSEEPSEVTTVQDSAGVAIVTVFDRPAISTIDVDSMPVLRIGGKAEGQTLYRVADAIRAGDGSVVVADGASREIRFFDSDGSLERVVGGEGEGPGEFDRFASLSPYRGDSLFVFDSWLRRATIYDAQGEFGRVLTLDPGIQARDLLPVGGESLLGIPWSLETFDKVEGPYRLPYYLVVMTSNGAVIDTALTVPGSGGYKVPNEAGGYRDLAPLYILNAHVAASGLGGVVGSGERWEFARLDVNGRVRQIVRVPWMDRSLTTEEIERERAAMVRPQSSADYRAIVARMEAPELRPAYGDLLLASNGWVWAAEYRSLRTEVDNPVRWLVFDESGAPVGRATTPSRFTLFEVGDEHLVGVRRDSLDVETVEVLSWALRPPT
mgnify:CR=1 FL=1